MVAMENKMPGFPDALGKRQHEHGVDRIFPRRWSPRAMSGEGITREELLKLFEAARWAPSSFNSQGWRFLYALRETLHWDTFFGLLGDYNKVWCKNAAVLFAVVSKNTFDHNGKPNRTHSFTAGCAWENLALQGSEAGLVVHAMQGFDYDRARTELNIPDDYTVEIMAAVGRPGEAAELPDNLRARETPSDRKPVGEISCEGPFAF